MADFRAVATGDFSNLANWEYSTDGGLNWNAAVTLPVSGDDVYSNGFNITFDIDVEVSLITNSPFVGVSVGGAFYFGDGNTVIADIAENSSGIRVLYNTTGLRKIVVGDISSVTEEVMLGGSPITIIGNVSGPDRLDTATIRGVPNIIVTGICRGGTSWYIDPRRSANALMDCDNAIVSIAMSTPGGAAAYGVAFWNTNGSAIVDTVQYLDSNTDGPKCVYGSNIRVSNIINMVDSSSLIDGGALLSSIDPVSVTLTIPRDGGSVQVDYLAGSANYPSETDVEEGVVYGNSNQFTGTMKILDPVDFASSFAEELRTTTEPELVRIRTCATDDSVGNIVTSTLGAP